MVRNSPEDTRGKIKAPKIPDHQVHNEWTRLRTICKHPQTWWIAVAGFACWAPISTFATLWGIPFLMTVYHTTATIAAHGVTFVWIGISIGGPLMGWWSGKIHSRRIPLLVAAVTALIASLGIIYLPKPNWWIMDTLLFFFGVAAAAQAVTFGLVKDIHPSSVVGTAMGFNNMAVVLGGVILQPLIGIILHAVWQGNALHGAPIYLVSSYQKAFVLIPLCAVIGLINILFFVKETHCQHQFKTSHA